FNTKKHQSAKNAFEKDFFKLMNNLVYSKTMENVCKYQDVKLITMNNKQDKKKFINQICKPFFKYARQLGGTLYNYVKEKYRNNAKLGYMDTDSFIYLVETKDIYKDMTERPNMFDLNNSKIIGLFKDKTSGNVITESYHIRTKSYYYVLADKFIKSKHKRVTKKGMSKMASKTYFSTLGGSLLNETVNKAEIFNPITQVYHDCFFRNEALCLIDTKHWILSDEVTSLPYNHWCIRVYKNMVKDNIPHEEVKKKTMRYRPSKKYQNKYVSHISSSLQ
ncbi:12662_t:CDS:2, partial [Cetraspora pellucida]